VPSARATRGLELGLLGLCVAPLVREWFETTHASSRLSYALLVPLLALVLALERRGRGAEEARPGSGWLWALLAAGALSAGSLSGVFTLALLGVPLAVVAWVERAFGPAVLRRQAPALALLVCMVPPPMPLLDRVNPFLIRASGETATWLLRPFDPAASWADATLGFRGWQLVVAEACSGSGTFLMLGTLGAFLAGLFGLRPLSAALLVLASLALTLLVNGARIASSALVIAAFGARAGEGPAHELLGQFVVLLAAGALALVVERATARRRALATR
jgi:exosortase/archaeosortase family protein